MIKWTFLCVLTLFHTLGWGQPFQLQKGASVSHEILFFGNQSATQEAILTELIEEGIEVVELERLSRFLPLYLLTANDSVGIESVLQVQAINQAQYNHYLGYANDRSIPNDPLYTGQWALQAIETAAIQAPLAWDIASSGITVNGDTTVIAIVDGGVAITHPDLNLFKNIHEIPNNQIDDDLNGYVDDVNGWNVFTQSGQIGADPHGSQVAGVAAAHSNNGIGVSGVAWNAKILPVVGNGTLESEVVAAYAYVYDMRYLYNRSQGDSGAFVVASNSSFGLSGLWGADFPLWCAMYDSLGSVGVLSVASGPNSGWNIDINGDMPCTCTSNFLVSVTGLNKDGSKPLNAGYGAVHIDMAAPSETIMTTSNIGYAAGFGTSVASPFVSGAIALGYSALCPEQFNQYDDAEQLAVYLRNTLMASGTSYNPNFIGYSTTEGQLDIGQYLHSLRTFNCNQSLLIEEVDSCGTCLGQVEVVPSTGEAPFTYFYKPLLDTIFYESPSSLVDNLCPGSYVFRVIDNRGYSSLDTTILDAGIDSIIVLDSIQFVSQSGASDGAIVLEVMGGTPPYSFVWSNGYITQDIYNLSMGNYAVTISDNSDCLVIDDFDVFVMGMEEVLQENLKIEQIENAIVCENLTADKCEITVYSVLGELIHTQQIKAKERIVIKTDTWQSGIYLLGNHNAKFKTINVH